MLDLLLLLGLLLVILVAAEIFVNALEHLGDRLRISEGVTGSLFAAVGTAMPETVVPLLALFAGTADQALNEEIGVGAILGAPLMLATLAMGILALVAGWRRGWSAPFHPEPSGLRRDLDAFLLAYAAAALAMAVPHQAELLRVIVALGLVIGYFVYVLATLRASERLVADGHGTEADRPLLLTRCGLREGWGTILAQMVLGLVLLVAGAKGFVHEVEQVASMLGVSALLVSLVLAPVATELPEKVNSVLWVRQGKDTLAFGNLTGAMVFQGTLLPALGILMTPWEARAEAVLGIGLSLAGAIWLRWCLARGGLRVWQLLINGALYPVYLAGTLVSG